MVWPYTDGTGLFVSLGRLHPRPFGLDWIQRCWSAPQSSSSCCGSSFWEREMGEANSWSKQLWKISILCNPVLISAMLPNAFKRHQWNQFGYKTVKWSLCFVLIFTMPGILQTSGRSGPSPEGHTILCINSIINSLRTDAWPSGNHSRARV